MVAGAGGAALEAAQQHTSSSNWTHKEKAGATEAKKNLESIFKAIQAEMTAAAQNGQQITNEKAEQSNSQINEYMQYAESLGEINQTIADQMEKALQTISEAQKEIEAKQEERQKLVEQLEALGGEAPAQEVPEESGEEAPVQNDSQTGETGKSAPKHKAPSSHNHMKTNGGNENSSEIQNLLAQIGAIDEYIANIYTQIAQPQAEIAEGTATFIENQAEIVEGRDGAIEAQSEGQSEISGIKTETNNTVTNGRNDLAKLGQQETQAFTSNSAKAMATTPLKVAVEAEKLAVKASDPFADTSAYDQAATDLDDMNTDLNVESGAAGINQENVKIVTDYMPQIQQASQQLMTGDFTSYTNTINDVFSQALGTINQQLQIQLPTGESGEIENVDAGEVIADNAESSDKTSNDSDKSSKWGDALNKGMDSLLGNIGGGDITSMAGDLAGDLLKGIF